MSAPVITDDERALQVLLPVLRKFESAFANAVRSKDTATVRLEIRITKGKVTEIDDMVFTKHPVKTP